MMNDRPAHPVPTTQHSAPTDATTEPQTFLCATEAAVWLRISPVTLARWRIEGSGPPFRRFGRRVVYARADLLRTPETRPTHDRATTGELGL
jgi:hypothetical protein